MVGNGFTTAVLVAVKVQPPKVYVYVIVDEPTPATEGQNWFPLTPTPLQAPPGGVPDKVTHGAFTHKLIGTIVGTMFNTKTSKSTGGLTQPNELVAKTETALVIRPGFAVPQLTVI